jgi:hypothetical protein
LAVGLRTAAGRRLLWSVPVVVAGFLLSTGPGPEGSWRPFDLVSAMPGLASFRVPGRMAVLVPLGMAMLIGLAVRAIPRRARTASGLALAVILFAEAHMAFLPAVPSHVLETPAIFREAERERPSGLLMLPMLGGTPGWPSEADYLLYAMPAWVPVLNGYGRRTSSIYDAVQRLVKEKHNGLGDALRFYHVSHVIVLKDYLPTEADAAAEVSWSADLEFVAEADGDLLYRVRPGSNQVSLRHVQVDSRGPATPVSEPGHAFLHEVNLDGVVARLCGGIEGQHDVRLLSGVKRLLETGPGIVEGHAGARATQLGRC